MTRKSFIIVNAVAFLILLLMGINASKGDLFSMTGFTLYIIVCAIWCACNLKIYGIYNEF